MTNRTRGVTHQGVLFFEGDTLVKEMLHVEFEAVLDQVVGLPEFAGQEVRAVFVQINQRLQIVGAVFFLVEFDQRGYVNRSWNVPLLHLLDNAGRGPDLGAGRIRLTCRSQCPIPWHARQLWDPELEGDASAFAQMQTSVQRNRLGLPVEAEPPTLELPTLTDMADPARKLRKRRTAAAPPPASVDQITRQLEQKHQDAIAALEERHRLQIATLKSGMLEQVEQLRQRQQARQTGFREALDETRKALTQEKRKAAKWKEQLERQAAEFRNAREQAQRELTEVRGSEEARSAELAARLQQQFELEIAARVEQARVELKEMLEMREVELFYREEQLGNLREEIARLRQEREGLLGQSSDRLLSRLVEGGVAFVAYHPGVEAMPIPAADIPRYLDSPQAYVAEKCFVSLDQYLQWLNHYDLPVCAAETGEGGVCGEPLPKIERPADFIPGESDCCPAHRLHYARSHSAR
jgi:hypothetical protein